MELSREDLTEDEARLVDRLNRRRAIIELAHREWDAARLVERVNNLAALGRVYDLVSIGRALAGSSDLEKVKGVTPASATGFTVQELLSLGVSLDGVARVIAQTKVQSCSVCQKEPRFATRVLCEKFKDFCNGVLSFVNIKRPARNEKLNHKVTPFRCRNCKGCGCRLWPALSDEEIERSYKNWREGTGARWQNA